jgi:hypothetical protein
MVTVSIFLLPLFGTILQKMKKGTGYFFLTPSALKLCKFCKSGPIVKGCFFKIMQVLQV